MDISIGRRRGRRLRGRRKLLEVHGEEHGFGSDIVVVLTHLQANKVSVTVTHR